MKKITAKILLCGLTFFLTSLPLVSLTVNLKEPTYEDGALKTEKGGIIEGTNLRIQARNILYVRKEIDNQPIERLEAEGDLILEFGEYLFVGERLEYDFQKNTGVLYDGRTGIEPWFVGGKEIHLCSDGSYIIYQGFATTSENYKRDWGIEVDKARIQKNRFLTAKNVSFRFVKIPLFWMPSFRINLDTIFDSPIRYTVRWGGSQGPRIGMTYEIFSWERWKAFLRLDYRTRRGLGGGLEVAYKSLDHCTCFRSVNYIADDTTLYNAKKRTRYRFQGLYNNSLDCGRTNICLSYDKLSDKDMATDYSDKGLHLETARRTQFQFRRQNQNWILNFLTRLRLNDFQTVKQELPTLDLNMKTFGLGKTGILVENRLKGSYLELEYTNHNPCEHDYNSPRYELAQKFYRPFLWGPIYFTPEVGGVAIYYGNSKHHLEKWMTIALIELNANTNLYRFFGNTKHVITPYLNYQYYTHPSTSPNDHYIFDIDDGWYYLNTLRFGVANHLYTKTCNNCIWRYLYADFFAYAFFDTDTISTTIPQIYSRIVYSINPRVRYKIQAAWDFERNRLYHFNNSIEWTVSSNAAISLEFHHRSAFDWRKVDHTNFILNSFRDEAELEHSELSDRRDTFLVHYYYRWHPNWATEFQSRHGWNRKFQRPYNEFQIDFLGVFRSAWNFKFSYRHREDEDRFSVNFSLGLKCPEQRRCCSPCLEF